MRWAFAVAVCLLAATAAGQVATVTLMEGPAVLTRGTARYVLTEGVRLQPGDIIEVGDKGITEVEFADGAALAMNVGTRLLVISAPRGKASTGDYYLVQGALKLSNVKQGSSFRFMTPIFTLQPAEGTIVFLVTGDEGSVFVETGDARLTEAASKAKGVAPAGPIRLKTGEYYSRKAEQKGVVASRPAPAFIGALPKVFLDPLPSRMARYKEREVQPKRLDEASYAEVETWLKAPPEIRRPMVARFRPRVSDPAFRAALVTNLKFHPEWDPILFPEKYRPKEPAANKSGARSDSAAARP